VAVIDPILDAIVGRRPVFASLLRYLHATGFQVPAEIQNRDPRSGWVGNDRVQALLAEVYAESGDETRPKFARPSSTLTKLRELALEHLGCTIVPEGDRGRRGGIGEDFLLPADRVNPYPLPGHKSAKRLGQGERGRLRDGVGRNYERQGGESVHREDVDDGTARAGDRRQEGLGHGVGPEEVDG
jgi:hypothetical protein